MLRKLARCLVTCALLAAMPALAVGSLLRDFTPLAKPSTSHGVHRVRPAGPARVLMAPTVVTPAPVSSLAPTEPLAPAPASAIRATRPERTAEPRQDSEATPTPTTQLPAARALQPAASATQLHRELGGRVSAFNGAPLPGLKVTADRKEEDREKKAPLPTTLTGPLGEFSFSGLEPGEYAIAVSDARGFTLVRSWIELSGAGAWIDLFADEPARIRCRVASGGATVPIVKIVARGMSEAVPVERLADGTFSISVPPGLYRLEAVSPASAEPGTAELKVRRPVRVRAGETKELELGPTRTP